MLIHPIPPLYDPQSRVLILGSFPSPRSREAGFFYGHPQNRFWKVMARVLEWEVPSTIEEKSAMLHACRVAVWDTIASCDIVGASDASITNVVPNDLSLILDSADIQMICCNGAKSHQLYMKYIYPRTGRKAEKLPSTSPANAACSLERLTAEWMRIREVPGILTGGTLAKRR